MPGSPADRQANHLGGESSPYLLQHAYNPVDWYPWGEAAFSRAKKLDRPILLSIGYSTCHWCHVMARESFEDQGVADVVNASFVSIKVDREERPDVDAIYMAAVHQFGQRGGWPLTAFLTPEGKPFFAGTYFPKDAFLHLLDRVKAVWANQRGNVMAQAQAITDAVNGQTRVIPGELPAQALNGLTRALLSSFDRTFGGFGAAPKFPRPPEIVHLLRVATRKGGRDARHAAIFTLDRMAAGGMHDQIGGGFHRYSTDARWLVPHFEKMLYDQAQLARAYLDAYQLTREPRFARIARDIFAYVLRDLRDPAGGFYSAEDADSPTSDAPWAVTARELHDRLGGGRDGPEAAKHGVEGLFYLWNPSDLTRVLGAQTATLIGAYYEVSETGNFAEAGHRGSILQTPVPLAAFARQRGLDPGAFAKTLAEAQAKLLGARAKRPRPALDDKVLVSWNALMIAALARGARVLNEPAYAQAAREATDFILATMQKDGKLLRRYRRGNAAIEAFSTDYAALTLALFELYESTFEPRYLREAQRLAHATIDRFWDAGGGGLLLRPKDAAALIAPAKSATDGAVPSANSLAAVAFLKLGHLLQDAPLWERGLAILKTFAAEFRRYPLGFPFLALALDFAVGPRAEIVIAGDPATPGFQGLARAVHGRFLPRAVLAHSPGQTSGDAELGDAPALVPFARGQPAIDGQATLYVCQDYTCQLPATELDAARQRLDALADALADREAPGD